MERTKVVQLIHGFSTGGAESLVKQYCILFNKERINLLVIALHNHHSVFDQELAQNQIKVIYIDDIIDDTFRIFPGIVKKAMHRVFRKILVKKYTREFSPDVIHYHLLLSEYVKYINPSMETKVFLTIHSAPEKVWAKNSVRQKDKRAVEWLIKNKKMHLIALHEQMRKQVNALFNVNDTVVIRNGVIINRFVVSQSREELRNAVGVKKNSIVIGHIGRFIEVKNHKFLIDVFENYLKYNPETELVLVGVGELQSSIKSMVDNKGLSERTHFLGMRSDIPELLHMMDVIVFPSLYEGLPVTLIEAQVAKVPCLVSDNVTKEVKISNIIHFLSIERSADDWAREIDQILHSKEESIVDTREWDLHKIVNQIEDIYTADNL